MNSTNIKVMSEEIQWLKDKLHAVDVEVPDPSEADDGQILTVDNGKYVISDPELPATTEAATGDVLGLTGEGKVPGWITPYTPRDYSTTETDTGVKWIDGKAVYEIVFSDTLPDSSTTKVIGHISYDKVVSVIGYQVNASGTINPTYNGYIDSTGDVVARPLAEAYYEGAVVAIVRYTKPSPTPGSREPEETEVKKVSKKKTTK